MQINSVLGPIDTSQLGFTLVHEHLLIGWAGWQWDNAWKFDRANEMAKAIDMLQELRSLGVRTFVDPCPMDIGRDAEFMAEASQKSGMTIIGSTGLYHHEMGIPSYFHAMPEEQIAEIFINDLTVGMGHTGIKAGIIKTATTAGQVTEQEQKTHAAAARAQAATGVPIITHTDENGPMGIQQLDIFESRGGTANRIAIGHSCGNGDIRYLLRVLERGAWLAFDRFGFGLSASDDVRVAALLGLIGLGYADRVMISHDSVSTFLQRPGDWPPEMAAAIKDWKPTHIIKNIIPRLKAAGVSQQTIDTITIDNPRRYFEGSAAGPGERNTIIAIAVFLVAGPSRVIRAQALTVKQNMYVEAARAMGCSSPRILIRHVLPNVFDVIVVIISINIAFAIITEAALSFIGLGIPPPNPDWGGMVSGTETAYLAKAPWIIASAGGVLAITVFAFNMLGDALRDILDPRLRQL